MNKYQHHGKNDLFHLCNLRKSFSKMEISQIASQLLDQLANLHQHNLVYKYLSPKSLIITQGLSVSDSAIKLQISYIAMMQLIDVPEHLTLQIKMCGLKRLYMAPEVKDSNG